MKLISYLVIRMGDVVTTANGRIIIILSIGVKIGNFLAIFPQGIVYTLPGQKYLNGWTFVPQVAS